MKIKILLFITAFVTTSIFSQRKWTLKECVDRALLKNLTIKQNKLNVKLAKTDVVSSKSNLIPNVNASTGGNFGFGSTFDPVTNNRIATSIYGGSFGVGAGVTVFNGYRNLNSYKQAKLGVEGSILDLAVIENDISLGVVNAYLNVLFAKENLNVSKTQAEISSNQIKAAKTRFEAGAIPKSDLLNIQSTAANDKQAVVTQENNLNIALLNLAQLLQVPHKDFDIEILDVSTPSITLLYSNSSEVYKKALLERPEIKRARLNIESAKLGVQIAKSVYLPSITANGNISTNYGYNLSSSGNSAFFTQLNNNLGYGFGFNVSVPVFTAKRNDASVQRSVINKEIVETRLESEKLRLQQTIEQSFLDAKAAAKAYEAAQLSLESQKEAFKNAQESYNYGAMTLFDFDQVRNRLVNAESAMIRSKYNYVFTTKVLKFYYGENILD